MDKIITQIVNCHSKLFGLNPRIEKINVGFTNTLYKVNDSYIIKICTDKSNEKEFKQEINFYNSNKENSLIPKLYYSSLEKTKVPYFYEILEKVNGVSLFNVWHTFSEEERENVVKEICSAMKQMHNVKGTSYDWSKSLKKRFNSLFRKIKPLNIFSKEEISLLNRAYLLFDKYLKSDEFVLVHNDLHFDNIIVNNGKIKIIDFERSMYAPKDFELDIIYRMIRKPWKFASEETEKYTNKSDYSNIMTYISRYYPELFTVPSLSKRLAIYDIVYFLNQLLLYPSLYELKNDVLLAASNVVANNNILN